jgi:outer membrane lipoprotein-sorting protein
MKRLWVMLCVIGVGLTGGVGWAQESSADEEAGGAEVEESSSEEAASEESQVEKPSADEVVEKLDDLYRSDASRATMKMTVRKPRGTRTLTLENWSKGDEHALVVIRKPAREAGTATLRTPDGLWNYAPRADRLIRIPSGMLSDNWMGSHFTNDDLMRESSYDEDYKGTVEAGEREGQKIWRLILEPKPNAPVVYSKLVFEVTRRHWVPLRTEYYDEGEVIRTMTYSKVEKVDGKRIPMVMTLKPADADDEMTRVTYEELEFDIEIDDRMFSRRGLRRVAR